MINNVSVWWHVIGVAVIIALLVIVPDEHPSLGFVFGERINNSGFDDGASSGLFFWLYLLPIGFLLTQYTITGFDASAHLSEETHGASRNAARGVWTSIFYSAIIGWLVLLAITFAVQDPANVSDPENGFGVGSVFAILAGALDSAGFKAVVLICTVGQLFCGLACLTSASRMCFAFSRDRGMPGSRHLAKVNKDGVPFNAVMAMAALALIITIPALKGAPGTVLPVAFFAVISICVIGLYICYAIPIFLRWRMGDKFEQAQSWNLGSKWRWMNPIAVVWVAIITTAGLLPTRPLGVPWDDAWDTHSANYAPMVLLVVIAARRARFARAPGTRSPARYGTWHPGRRGFAATPADRPPGPSPGVRDPR